MEQIITKEYLKANTDHIFVFGDNTLRKGLGGAAALRYETNTHGFITKKYPDNKDTSFFRPDEYKEVFEKELAILEHYIICFPKKTFLISKLGAGLANRYKIWENIIQPGLECLKVYPNVRFLYD